MKKGNIKIKKNSLVVYISLFIALFLFSAIGGNAQSSMGDVNEDGSISIIDALLIA